LECTEQILRDACGDSGTGLAEFNGEASHARPLVNFPTTTAISRLASSLKGVSPRKMRQESPDLTCHYWRYGRGPASPGPPAASITVLRQYTEQRTTPPDTSQGPSALTTGLKAGALADNLVAVPNGGSARWGRWEG
jgi:putative transposase